MPVSPPTVGLSFGSFGDIVAVLQLAWQLRAALGAAGASAELRALASDVDVFARALQDVQAAMERGRKPLVPSVRNGIAAALSQCRDVLLAIQQHVDRAQLQISASGWNKYWGTAAWSILGGKKDVDSLRARLAGQLAVIQLYVTLSLSEATGPQPVPDAFSEQNSFLKRLYSVVQDIHLRIRFEDGVPGFRFHDVESKADYPPFAVTSLDKLRQVYDALWHGERNLSSWLTDEYGITEDDFRVRTKLSSQVTITISSKGNRTLCTECFFVRNVGIDQWHVFVGAPGFLTAEQRVLKSLLEGTHTVMANCNSVTYGIRYQGVTNDFIRHLEAAQLFSEAVRLILDRQHPGCFRPGWLDGLIDLFYDCTDPEPLRSTILPTLLLQDLSAEETFDLIAGAFKTSPATILPSGTSVNATELDFRVYGRALVELLVRHALPLSTSSRDRALPFPDWVYGGPAHTTLEDEEHVESRGSFDSIVDLYRSP